MLLEASILIATLVSIFLLYATFNRGLSYLVLAIILVRPSCEPVFGLAKTALGGETGPGGAVNFLVIGLGFLFFLLRPALLPTSTLPMWAAFILAASLSTLLSPVPLGATKTLVWLTSYLAMFSLPFAIIQSPEWAARCLKTALYSSFVPVGYAILELAIGGNAAVGDDGRLQGILDHPNIFAFYLVGVLCLSLFLLRSSRICVSARTRQLLVLYLPVLIFLIILTRTRSAWIATAFVFFTFASLTGRRYLALFLLFPLIALVPGVGERILDVRSFDVDYRSQGLDSYAWRQLLWDSAWDWMSRNPAPILGRGLNSFIYYVPDFFPLVHNSVEAEGVGAHNTFLQIYFEMGALGILSFGWLFLLLLWKLMNGYTSDRNGTIIVMSLVIAFLIESYSDNMLGYLVFEWFFWFIIGTVCAWNRLGIESSYPTPVLSGERGSIPQTHKILPRH